MWAYYTELYYEGGKIMLTVEICDRLGNCYSQAWNPISKMKCVSQIFVLLYEKKVCIITVKIYYTLLNLVYNLWICAT